MEKMNPQNNNSVDKNKFIKNQERVREIHDELEEEGEEHSTDSISLMEESIALRKGNRELIEKAHGEALEEEIARQKEADSKKLDTLRAEAGFLGESADKSEAIDSVSLNNTIVRIEDYRERQKRIDTMTPEEISAIVTRVADEGRSAEDFFSMLNNFNKKQEIVNNPAVREKMKKLLSSENIHMYDVDRIITLLGDKEIFNSVDVKKGIKESIRYFVSYQAHRDWPHVKDAVDRVVSGAGLSDEDLRDIAEGIKSQNKKEAFNLFVEHFGAKRLYPEI